MAKRKTGVAIEDLNLDHGVSPYEAPLLGATPRRDQSEATAAVEPGLLGPAEILILVVFVSQLVVVPFLTPGPSLVVAIMLGCWLSLPSMLAAWSTIRSGVWRYSFSAVLSLLNSFLFMLLIDGQFDLLMAALPPASALPVLLTLMVIKRAFGYFAPLQRDADQFLEGLRFNLLHLFIVTTLLALVLPIGKMLWSMQPNTVGPAPLGIFACLIVLISFNTLMFVWALMGKYAVLRTCIATPVGIAALLICVQVCNHGADYIEWCVLAGLPLASSFLLMAALRFSGWRFWKSVK